MTMNSWLEQQWQSLLTADSQDALLQQFIRVTQTFDFEYCTFGLRAPYPLNAPKALIVSNYPAAWLQRYHEQNYLAVDPVVQHGLHCTTPLVWSSLPCRTPFWEEAAAFGIAHGWSQAQSNVQHFFGMLSLARSSSAINDKELAHKQAHLIWLTQLAYGGFYRFLAPELKSYVDVKLTPREKEVLRWTADGNTTEQIAKKLHLSERTVKFHLQHTLEKLGAKNKTAAAVQAVLLGLI